MGKLSLVFLMFYLTLILHSKARILPEEINNSHSHDTDNKQTLHVDANHAPAESPTSTDLKDKKNFIYGGVGGFAGMGGYAGMIGGMPVLGGLGGMGKYGGIGGVGGLGGLGGGLGGGSDPSGGGKGGVCP